jgi:hypothetical protein
MNSSLGGLVLINAVLVSYDLGECEIASALVERHPGWKGALP